MRRRPFVLRRFPLGVLLPYVYAIAAVLLLGFSTKADTVQPGALANHPPREFLFGAEFDPQAPEPIRDLFYETDMNCVRMTAGGYEWAAPMNEKFTNDLEARGLKVYMQLCSHYPSADYFGLKDAWMVDQNGGTGVEDRKAWAISYSGLNWPQYSYTSIPFRDKLAKDFSTYVAHFDGNHNIAGVLLHNEPGFFWLSDRVFDYNPSSIAAFRKWLEQQDGSIAVLNDRWGTSYGSFADVTPPGKPSVSNLAAWLDWRRFSVWSVADFLHWESDLFKSLRGDVPRTTNLDGPLNNWYGYRCANILDYSATMDRVGMDIYPSPYTTRAFVPYSVDMLQGVAQGREANVMECEVFSAKLWQPYDETQRASLLSSEIWTMIGHGSDGIFLWGFNRTDNFSLTDGAFNERVLACRDIAYQCRMFGVQDFHRMPSHVALCVDPDSYLLESGREAKPLEVTSQLDVEYQGYYAALADAGFQSDVILLDQLRSGAAKSYDAIVIPEAMLMDENLAGQLKSFVSNGGTLIASAPFSERDRWAKPLNAIPAFGLDEVFGLNIAVGALPGQDEITSAQGKIAAHGTAGKLTLHGAHSIATFADGSPAITVNNFGRGKAILIAAKVGQPYLDGWGGRNLSSTLADYLQQGSIACTTIQASVPVDTSSIQDSHGNVLLVSSVLGSKGKLPAPASNISVTYPCDAPASYHSAFAFPATKATGGIVRSGPVEVPLTPTTDGKGITFQLANIDSSLPVLLAREATPLLAVAAPQTLTKGDAGEITVTCFNPSSNALSGKLELHAASAISQVGDALVQTPAYRQQNVVIHFKTDPNVSVPRLPLKVVLVHGENPKETAAVPVDLEIK